MHLGRNFFRFVLILLIIAGLIFVGFLFRSFVSTKLTEDLRAEATNRGTILAGSLRGDLQRHQIVPAILQKDDRVGYSLFIPDASMNTKFRDIAEELDNPDIFTVNLDLNIINSSKSTLIGDLFDQPAILDSVLKENAGLFYSPVTKVLYWARRVDDPITGLPLGMVVIVVELKRYQEQWRRLPVNLILADARGGIIFATDSMREEPYVQNVLGLYEKTALESNQFGKIYDIGGENFYVSQNEVLNGWKLIMFTPAQATSRLLAGYMSLYVLTVSSVTLFALYLLSRRAARASARFRRESEELRALNSKLVDEIEHRQKAERSLQTAEQSLEQSSKLAVIGQMSASIGHELNQPLAAMRTYMAGLRALLRRSRFTEAGQNMNRIEDLLDRMGSITRQMRSFARAPDGQEEIFDLRLSIQNSFELMTPQLGQAKVSIKRQIEPSAVMIRGDRIRVEQILINIFRNAIEAVSAEDDAKVEITLSKVGSIASVIIADNGVGFGDVEKLFEPFYTTKAPGEGLGLGLAISAQYAKDMGGNLLARPNEPKGAIFELKLPLADDKLGKSN